MLKVIRMDGELILDTDQLFSLKNTDISHQTLRLEFQDGDQSMALVP
jgi:hypothetical protein